MRIVHLVGTWPKKNLHGLSYDYKNISVSGGGGAIVAVNSTLKIVRSQFYNNVGDTGGSLFLGGSSILLQDLEIKSNKAAAVGGAIVCVNHSSLTIQNAMVTKNTVQRETTGSAGGFYIGQNSTCVIKNVSFVENRATFGGAVYSFGYCSVTIHNSSFQANSDSAIAFRSYISSEITDCQFVSNSNDGDSGGSVSVASSSSVNITNSVFKENKASRNGGSVYIEEQSHGRFLNCTFTGNTALAGGGNSRIKFKN